MFRNLNIYRSGACRRVKPPRRHDNSQRGGGNVSDLIRWHWRVGMPQGHYELHLDHLDVPANPDQFPYAEGHHFTLRWHDPRYPTGMDIGEHSEEQFVTEEFRDHAEQFARAERCVFWTVPITADLTVQVSLAAPELRYGDNENEGSAFRVSYTKLGERWNVARVDPAKPAFSLITAA
jgi:hypothetical protein